MPIDDCRKCIFLDYKGVQATTSRILIPYCKLYNESFHSDLGHIGRRLHQPCEKGIEFDLRNPRTNVQKENARRLEISRSAHNSETRTPTDRPPPNIIEITESQRGGYYQSWEQNPLTAADFWPLEPTEVSETTLEQTPLQGGPE